MIARNNLKPGTYYYFVLYEDQDLTVPVIETLRFEKEVPGVTTEGVLLLFERLGDNAPKKCRLTMDLLQSVFDFDGLVAELDASRQAQR